MNCALRVTFSYSCGHKETFPRIPINWTLKECISIEVLFLFDLLTIWRHGGLVCQRWADVWGHNSRKSSSIWHYQHPTQNCGGYIWGSILSIHINQVLSFSFSIFQGKKKKTAHKQIDGMVLFGVSVLWIIEYIFRYSSFFKQNPYWVPPLRYCAGSLLQSPTAPWPQRWRSRRGR